MFEVEEGGILGGVGFIPKAFELVRVCFAVLVVELSVRGHLPEEVLGTVGKAIALKKRSLEIIPVVIIVLVVDAVGNSFAN